MKNTIKQESVQVYEDLLRMWEVHNKADKFAGNPHFVCDNSFGDVAAVYIEDDAIMIGVPGTDKAKEWGSNFDFYPPLGGWHKSINDASQELFTKLYPIIFDIRKEAILPIRFGCHSRGGGLSQKLQWNLREAGFGGIEVVSFGSMRMCTPSGYKKLEKANCKHTMVTIKHDIVDNVPFKFMPFPTPTIWKSHYTEHIELDGVRHELNHLAFGEALRNKINELKLNP